MILLTVACIKFLIRVTKLILLTALYGVYFAVLIAVYPVGMLVYLIMALCGHEFKEPKKKPKLTVEIRDKRKAKRRDDTKYDWIAFWW